MQTAELIKAFYEPVDRLIEGHRQQEAACRARRHEGKTTGTKSGQAALIAIGFFGTGFIELTGLPRVTGEVDDGRHIIDKGPQAP